MSLELNTGIIDSLIKTLEELVVIPSISLEGPDSPAMKKCADVVAEQFRSLGASVEMLDVAGAPSAVFGEFKSTNGNAPTVLLYSHYDVQPVGNIDDWSYQPFEPVEHDGRLYGRGASDDKSGIVTHLGAIQLLLDDQLRLPCHVKFLIEGEEELGSPHASTFIEKYGEKLNADAVIIADSSHWSVGQPAVTSSLRGVVDCVLRVRSLNAGVHSGEYGGAVPDALMSISRIISTLHDDDGAVAIAGLVSSIESDVDITEQEMISKAGGVTQLQTIGRGQVLSRIWAQPAISVLAIDAPRISESVNLIVPEASAKISMRIPPGQSADDALTLLEEHLLSVAPWGVSATVTPGSIAEAFSADLSGPITQAFENGMAHAWERAPKRIGLGGSIPLVADLQHLLPKAEIVITGVGEPISRIHGPDESQDLGELRKNILAEAHALKTVGSMNHNAEPDKK